MTCRCPLPEHLDPPEDPTPRCACCGREADYCDILLVEEEREVLGLPDGVRDVDLCDEHDTARRETWGDSSRDALESLAIAAGVSALDVNVHPNLLAVRIGAKLPYHSHHNPGGIR